MNNYKKTLFVFKIMFQKLIIFQNIEFKQIQFHVLLSYYCHYYVHTTLLITYSPFLLYIIILAIKDHRVYLTQDC